MATNKSQPQPLNSAVRLLLHFFRGIGFRRGANLLVNLLIKISPNTANVIKKEKWRALWEDEAARPEQHLSQEIPTELVDAVDSNWFVAGGRVLDIGSGRGQVSAWLAGRGFKVVGADLSERGTKLAQKYFGHLPLVEFQTKDACRDSFGERCFNIIFDRGCLHTIDKIEQPLYVDNLSRCAVSGAIFMLFYPVKYTKEELIKHIESLFADRFSILSCVDTVEPMRRSAGPIPRTELPGMVFRMERI